MNRTLTTTCLAVLLASASVAAVAQTTAPKTRAEVRKELENALRDGTMPLGESGLTMREMFPARYPTRSALAAAAPQAPKMDAAMHVACQSQ
jgi:hypothetical protein